MYILSNRGHKVTFSKQFHGSMKGRTICWVLVEHKNIISSGKLLPWVTLYISIFTSTLCAPKYLVSFFEKVNTHTHTQAAFEFFAIFRLHLLTIYLCSNNDNL